MEIEKRTREQSGAFELDYLFEFSPDQREGEIKVNYTEVQ